jgi:KRAB domain-containing zinc finger protein
MFSDHFIRISSLDCHVISTLVKDLMNILYVLGSFYPDKQPRLSCDIHTGKRPYEYPLCSRSFYPDKQPRLSCDIHTGKKKTFYSRCSKCSQLFTHKCSLNKHMRLHSGEKPYECALCSRSFASGSNLQCHLRVHTGENLRCSECFQLFTVQTLN